MKKIKLYQIADEIIERYIEDKAEFDVEKAEAIEMLKSAVLMQNMDLNNDTTSYDLEELMFHEDYANEYKELQKIIKFKVANLNLEL